MRSHLFVRGVWRDSLLYAAVDGTNRQQATTVAVPTSELGTFPSSLVAVRALYACDPRQSRLPHPSACRVATDNARNRVAATHVRRGDDSNSETGRGVDGLSGDSVYSPK